MRRERSGLRSVREPELARIERRCRADALTILAQRHLDIPLVVHCRLGGGGEQVELVVEDRDALGRVRSTGDP